MAIVIALLDSASVTVVGQGLTAPSLILQSVFRMVVPVMTMEHVVAETLATQGQLVKSY